jgi:hypothetical protein
VKARIVPLDSVEHRLAQELLPWFVNSTLDADESAQVAAHLAHCSRCQRDAEEQARLRAVSLDAEPRHDVDRGWASLRSRLDAREAAQLYQPAARRWPPWKRWLPLAAALQAAVIFGLAATLIAMAPRSEPYRALGAAPSGVEPHALVVFRRDATNAQMRDALRSVNARIVGGPTVTDAYLLRLGDDAPDALARLRSQPGVITAESLQGETAK